MPHESASGRSRASRDHPQSPALVFRQHVRADDTNAFDLFAAGEQPDEPEGEEPSPDLPDARVVVEQSEYGGHGAPVHLRHGRRLGDDEVSQGSVICSISPADKGVNPQVPSKDAL